VTKKKGRAPKRALRYRGETPPKRVARLVFWEHVKELLGKEFLLGQHVVLLSQEAGDVSCLLGLGVIPGHIIGVDLDKHATAAAQAKHPKVGMRTQDVEAAVTGLRTSGQKVSSVFLDICAPMREQTVAKAAAVATQLKAGSVLGCAFLAGREVGDWGEKIEGAKARYKTRTGNRAFFMRGPLFFRELNKLTTKKGVLVIPTKLIYYVSHGPDRYGKPMIICVGTINRTEDAHMRKFGVGTALQSVEYEFVTATPFELGALAAELEADERPADLLLNASKQSVAAWKAHATRGTY
jgi:hypothetical protein